MEERGCLGGLLHFKQKGKIEEGCNEIWNYSPSTLQANFYPVPYLSFKDQLI